MPDVSMVKAVSQIIIDLHQTASAQAPHRWASAVRLDTIISEISE
jgi:hypothetical protein